MQKAYSSNSFRLGRQRPAWTCKQPQNRLPVRATVGEYKPESSSAPPPPPPPPPPPRLSNSFDRRVLLYLTIGSAIAGTTIVGLRQVSQSSTAKEYADIRLANGFKRELDGRVWLRTAAGKWMEVRLDAKVPGTVLMRDSSGAVYFLGFNNIQQIDLTDDLVVTAVFGDGEWEQAMRRVQAKDADGQLVDVRLGQDDFRNLISVLA